MTQLKLRNLNRTKNTLEISPDRKFPYLGKSKPKKGKTNYLVFDVESKTKLKSDGFYTHYPMLICYQFVTLDTINGNTKSPIHHCYTIKQFHAVCTQYLKEVRTFSFIAHNTTYDFNVMNMFKWLSDNNFRITLFNPAKGAFVIIARNSRTTISIIDNMNFFTGALKSIGEELGFKKLKMPNENAPIALWIKYCKKDVAIVTKCLMELSKISKQFGYGHLRLTRAQLAFSIYRSSFLEYSIKLHNDLDILKLEKQSYYGGRTEAFFIGDTGKNKKYYVDFNSLYPAVMKNNEFSTRYYAKFKNPSNKKFAVYMKMFNVCAKVDIETDKPIFPYQTKDRLLFPIGRFTTYLAYPELQYAYDNNLIKKVHYGSLYRTAEIFTGFITHFHNIKTKAKKNNKPALTYFAKLMLNSLYGKFGQNTPSLIPLNLKSEKRYEAKIIIDFEKNKIFTEKTINYEVYEETAKQISKYSSPIIASEVTSFARLKLWLAVEKAGINNVFYVDTDSLIVNQQGYDNLQNEIKENELGFLELEKTSNHCIIHALKDYEFGSEIKLKGVPSKAKKINESTYEYDSWFTTIRSLSQISGALMRHGKLTKELRRDNAKSLILPNGRCYPWALNEFLLANNNNQKPTTFVF